MAHGLFITLEGVEGSGKTTQAAMLGDALRKEGRRVTVTHEPGGTRAGETIRTIFLDPAVSLDVAAELLLVLADRAQHVREKLRPALEAGEIVISDRYSDSTVAYQGYGRGFDLTAARQLNQLATGGMMLPISLSCSIAPPRPASRAPAQRVQRQRTHASIASRASARNSIAGCATASSRSPAAEPERVVVIDADPRKSPRSP